MSELTIQHKGLGIRAVMKELTQRDLENFGAALALEKMESASQRRGANLRAAIRAGWFTELEPAIAVDQVADLLPVVVKFLGEWIDLVYAEVTKIPPE